MESKVCGVESVSVECEHKVWSGDWGVWSVKEKLWSGECGVWSVECGV